jgi:DNA-binding NarL/FixJ family response regulator
MARKLIIEWRMYWEDEGDEGDEARQEQPVFNDAAGLSKRQLEIATLLCNRHSVKKIADQLHISEHTVKKHIQNMKKTLQIEESGIDFLYALNEKMTSNG